MDKEELKQIYASIHTLRVEGDIDWDSVGLEYDISIHTLRMEGDAVACPNPPPSTYFNPRPPHGG